MKTFIRFREHLQYIVVLYAIWGLSYSDLLAQGSGTSPHPAGVLRTPTPEAVDELLRVLRDHKDNEWANDFRETYFGDIHSPSILDLVIFVDQDGFTIDGEKIYVRQSLSKRRKHIFKRKRRISNQVVWGERDLYVLFLMSTSKHHFTSNSNLLPNPYCGPVNADVKVESPIKSPAIKVHHSAIDRHQDPLLRRAINAFSSILNLEVDDPKSPAGQDSAKSVPLLLLNTSKDSTTKLLYGFSKLSLTENGWNRISVCGDDGLELAPYTTAIVNNFGNSNHSPMRIGVATGVSIFQKKEEDDVVGTTLQNSIRPNVYLYSTWYWRRMAPPMVFNYGLTMGTSIAPAGLFNDIYGALTIGELPNGLPAIQFGYSFFKKKRKEGDVEKSLNRRGLFIGFGFDL